MKLEVTLDCGNAAPETVRSAAHGLELALQKGGDVLVLPIPIGFPMELMPQVAAAFVDLLVAKANQATATD